MTEQQKRDYLVGRIIRYADKVGRFDEALEFIGRHRTLSELKAYQSDLTCIAYGKRLNIDGNYLVELKE